MPERKRGARPQRRPDQRRPPGRHSPAPPLSIALALILCFVVQCLSGMRQQSATYDEPVDIAAGYSYVETGDFRLKQDAPPLVATLSGLGLKGSTMFGNTLVLDTGSRLWNGRTEYRFADQFLARAGDARRTLQIARIPVILIGALLAFYLYRFGRLLVGDYGALVPLFLFCFDPNMIAHARIVSNDIAVAAFFFIAHYYFYRLLTEGTRAHLIAVGVAVALTTVAKFSGLLIVPSLMLVTGFFHLFPAVASLPPSGNAAKQRGRLRRVAGQALAVSTAATIVTISVLYQSPAGVVQYVLGGFGRSTRTACRAFSSICWASSARWRLVLLPDRDAREDARRYACRARNRGGLRPGLAIAGSQGRLAADPGRARPDRVFAGSCHARPSPRVVCVPVPFSLGRRAPRASLGALVADAQHVNRRVRAGMTAVAAAVALFAIVSAIRIHPYQLAYFNSFVGGPAAGPQLLDDSNIDWGQDLPGLAEWQAEHSGQSLALDYFGTDDPAATESTRDRSARPNCFSPSVRCMQYR